MMLDYDFIDERWDVFFIRAGKCCGGDISNRIISVSVSYGKCIYPVAIILICTSLLISEIQSQICVETQQATE